MLPLLHRPTFERHIADGLHLTEPRFGAIVLLVCALGSKFSLDPRVILEGTSYHSAGWKFFDQVQAVKRTFLVPPTLYDLQYYSVGARWRSTTPILITTCSWLYNISLDVRLPNSVGL